MEKDGEETSIDTDQLPHGIQGRIGCPRACGLTPHLITSEKKDWYVCNTPQTTLLYILYIKRRGSHVVAEASFM